jgi:hypothetical protein
MTNLLQPTARRRRSVWLQRGAILVSVLQLFLILLVHGYVSVPKPTFLSHSCYSTLILLPQQQPQHTLRLLAQKSRSLPDKKVPEFTVDESDDIDAEEFIAYETAPTELSVVQEDAVLSVPIAEPDVSNDVAVYSSTVPITGQKTTSQSSQVKVQYAAMEPGTVLQIQVGDMARARKAWKKRRRSDSPLLVPCSVLHVDRFATLRWNCIYLLEKFGSSFDGSGIQISLSELSMRHRTHLKSSLLHHALDLGFASSHELLEALFHKQVQDAYGVRLVTRSSQIVEAISDGGDEDVLKDNADATPPQLWLETPLSRARAQSRSAKAAVLQFCEPPETADILQHTGYARIKRDPKMVVDSSTQSSNMYQLQPLSVALRVGSEDLDHLVSNGSRHAAVVFDYDVQGDAGVAPLLTLSLNPQRNQVRERLKQKQKLQRFGGPNMGPNGTFEEGIRWFHNLKVGEGPYSGKVLRLIKGGALVDCGIRRHRRQRNGADVEDPRTANLDHSLPVFGFLRFKDAVLSDENPESNQASSAVDLEDDEDDEDWNSVFTISDLDAFEDEDEDDEEHESDEIDESSVENFMNDDNDLEEEEDAEEKDVDGEVLAAFNLENDDMFEEGEDITHLFELRDDGTLEYTDPETGVTQIISDVTIDDRHEDDDDEINHDSDDSEDDGPLHLSSIDSGERTFKSPTYLLSSSSFNYKTQTLHIGDRIDVYVKLVSKQSSQLLLSMDSSIRGRKAKDLKKESEVSRKLSRLVKQLGGYKQIRILKGVVCQGVIQATSNTGRGEWFYVQPEEMASQAKLPVGIATVLETSIIRGKELNVGDTVQIQINGIDEDRGQLAMTILDKLTQ